MSEKVYGICGTNKCRKEVIPKEESYTKEQIDFFVQSHFGDLSEHTYLYELQQVFNAGISSAYLGFIGEIPILIINALTGGTSFKQKAAKISLEKNRIPTSTILYNHMIAAIERYEATYCRFYGGSIFSMGAKLNLNRSSNVMDLVLEHHGHGESGAYQYMPTGTMVFVFGPVPN